MTDVQIAPATHCVVQPSRLDAVAVVALLAADEARCQPQISSSEALGAASARSTTVSVWQVAEQPS
jgi:hypothetical protein